MENPQVKMRGERSFRTKAQGSFMLGILGTIQPKYFDPGITEDAARLTFCPFDGRDC